MLKTLFLIILSYFAVIGIIEFVLTILETFSVSKYSQLTDITVTATLSGPVKNVAFLLNTLLLQTQRLTYKNATPKLVVKTQNTDEDTYSQIFDFCLENDNITVEKHSEL